MGCSEVIQETHKKNYKICKFCGNKLYGESRTGDRSEHYATYYVYPSCSCENGIELKRLRDESDDLKRKLNYVAYKIRVLEETKPCESYNQKMMNIEIAKIKKKYGF